MFHTPIKILYFIIITSSKNGIWKEYAHLRALKEATARDQHIYECMIILPIYHIKLDIMEIIKYLLQMRNEAIHQPKGSLYMGPPNRPP